MNNMGTRMCFFTVSTSLHINLRHNLSARMCFTFTNNGAVNAQTLDRLLHVLNINHETVSSNHAGISCLSAALRIERGFVQNNLDLIARFSYGNGNPILQQSTKMSFGTKFGVPGKDRTTFIHELTKLREVCERTFFSLSISLSTVTLLSHQFAERLLINLYACFSSHFKGQVDWESVGIVQRKCFCPRNRV